MVPGDHRRRTQAAPRESGAADRAAERALEAIGFSPADPAHDGFLDPSEACEAVERGGGAGGEAVLLRAGPELVPCEGEFASKPAAPWWLRVERGGAVRAVPIREDRPAIQATVSAVHLEAVAIAVPGAKTSERTVSRALLELDDGSRWVVSERLGPTISASLDGVRSLAHGLAKLVGAEVIEAGLQSIPSAQSLEGVAPPIAVARRAGDLSRHALRFEGHVAVLRDHASEGPRDSLRRHAGVAATFAAGAILMWVLLARSVAGEAGWTTLFGLGAVASILSLAAYAFAGVARFAGKYRATSRPLLWIGPDRFVVAPWVDREGAVDQRPEGRLGAAISLRELQGVSVRPRDDAFAVELATEHGPIDAMSGLDEELATFWCQVIEAKMKDASDPLAAPKRRADRAQRASRGGKAGPPQEGEAESLPMNARANR